MTSAEAPFNNSLRPRKPEGSLGRTAQNVHLDSHTAPELCVSPVHNSGLKAANHSNTSTNQNITLNILCGKEKKKKEKKRRKKAEC